MARGGLHLHENGGVTGHPETMWSCTNVLGPLVPLVNCPGNTMSQHIPANLHQPKTFYKMHNDRDVSVQGHFVTRDD